MMKAYDRLEWDYLQPIMGKLGFATQWIQIVMAMVRSVSFSVLFNGEKLEQFGPSRGIRQGDPILVSNLLDVYCAASGQMVSVENLYFLAQIPRLR